MLALYEVVCFFWFIRIPLYFASQFFKFGVVSFPLFESEIGMLFPVRLERKRFAIRFILFAVALIAVGALLELFPSVQPWSMIGWSVLALTFKTIALDIPRARDMGWNPWILLLQLVPGLGLLVVVLLLAVPSNTFSGKRLSETKKTGDTSEP